MITVNPSASPAGTDRPDGYTGRHRRAGGEARPAGPVRPGRCAHQGRHRARPEEAAPTGQEAARGAGQEAPAEMT